MQCQHLALWAPLLLQLLLLALMLPGWAGCC
jgi:hypothetical protein